MTGSVRRAGRPSTVSRAAIARAVIEIGFDDATVKSVADRLGVSVPGLYHHVKGRDELLRIASESFFAERQLPAARGLAWPEWLRQLGWKIRNDLTTHPEVLNQFITGAAMPDGPGHLETALEVLGDFGFSPMEAMNAFQTVGQLAVGAAADEMREKELVEAGRHPVADLYAAIAANPRDYQRLQALLADLKPERRDAFNDRLTIVLQGIAATRGQPWRDALIAPE